jgi:phosphohistidine phosphatase SixA
MQLVFVRHGPKERSKSAADADQPLTSTATALGDRLRAALEARELVPRYILTSRYRHARETAELLRAKRTRAVIEVTALTPHTRQS